MEVINGLTLLDSTRNTNSLLGNAEIRTVGDYKKKRLSQVEYLCMSVIINLNSYREVCMH